MKELQFIRAGLSVEPIVVGRVEDILPRVRVAVARLSEPEAREAAPTIERM
jgi:hypothetical protein